MSRVKENGLLSLNSGKRKGNRTEVLDLRSRQRKRKGRSMHILEGRRIIYLRGKRESYFH